MSIQFYYQERQDGGRRCGLMVDGQHVLHTFHEGGEERDPAIVWYADVALLGAQPPPPGEGLSWLNTHGQEIRDALTSTARELTAGLDPDPMPRKFTFQGGEGPVSVYVSATHVLTARQIGDKLKWLAGQDWNELFPAPQAVGGGL